MFSIYGSNDTTGTLIAKKYTLGAALVMASELLDWWDDVYVREDISKPDDEGRVVIFERVVARLSAKGLVL